MSTWPLPQGRCVDGAPTLRILSCAGEYPSPFNTSYGRRGGLTRHTVPGDAPPRSTCGYAVPIGLSMTNRQVPSAWRRTTSVPRAELEVCLPSGPVLVIV